MATPANSCPQTRRRGREGLPVMFRDVGDVPVLFSQAPRGVCARLESCRRNPIGTASGSFRAFLIRWGIGGVGFTPKDSPPRHQDTKKWGAWWMLRR